MLYQSITRYVLGEFFIYREIIVDFFLSSLGKRSQTFQTILRVKCRTTTTITFFSLLFASFHFNHHLNYEKHQRNSINAFFYEL